MCQKIGDLLDNLIFLVIFFLPLLMHGLDNDFDIFNRHLMMPAFLYRNLEDEHALFLGKGYSMMN